MTWQCLCWTFSLFGLCSRQAARSRALEAPCVVFGGVAAAVPSVVGGWVGGCPLLCMGVVGLPGSPWFSTKASGSSAQHLNSTQARQNQKVCT